MPRKQTPATWAEGVKALRESLGMTQVELAEKSGASQPAISRIERGSRKVSDATRVKVATALGVNAHDLFPYEPESIAS